MKTDLRLLLYNPENDLALAADAVSYTPRAAALRMRDSGVLLPLWWAEDNDALFVPESMVDAAIRLKTRYGLGGVINPSPDQITSVMPWGWSKDVRRRCIAAGISPDILPDDNKLDVARLVSHRKSSIAILKEYGMDRDVMPVEYCEPEAALAHIAAIGECVIKMPWSGSGRGVFFTRSMSRPMLEKTVSDVIHRQGSIIVEHEFDKVRDFAALYYRSGNEVNFRGLSLFSSLPSGQYSGNSVVSQHDISHAIGMDVYEVAERVGEILTDVTRGCPDGWMGVDMMVYKDSFGDKAICPCVELNLRMTMGVLALYLSKRIMPEVGKGTLYSSAGDLPADAVELSPCGGDIKYIYQKSRSNL